MSSWTYLNGIIKIDNIKKDGIIKMYHLKKNISEYKYDEFMNNLKNFDYKIEKRFSNKYVIIDHTKKVEEFLKTLHKPTGSEGGIEYCIGNYPECLKLWGHTGSSSSRDLLLKEKRFISDNYEEKLTKKQEKLIEGVWESDYGSYFVICLYGSLRDRTFDETKKELIDYIKELSQYFNIDDINLNLKENCNVDSTITYDWCYKTNEESLKFKTTNIHYEYSDDYRKCKTTKSTETQKIILNGDLNS